MPKIRFGFRHGFTGLEILILVALTVGLAVGSRLVQQPQKIAAPAASCSPIGGHCVNGRAYWCYGDRDEPGTRCCNSDAPSTWFDCPAPPSSDTCNQPNTLVCNNGHADWCNGSGIWERGTKPCGTNTCFPFSPTASICQNTANYIQSGSSISGGTCVKNGELNGFALCGFQTSAICPETSAGRCYSGLRCSELTPALSVYSPTGGSGCGVNRVCCVPPTTQPIPTATPTRAPSATPRPSNTPTSTPRVLVSNTPTATSRPINTPTPTLPTCETGLYCKDVSRELIGFNNICQGAGSTTIWKCCPAGQITANVDIGIWKCINPPVTLAPTNRPTSALTPTRPTNTPTGSPITAPINTPTPITVQSLPICTLSECRSYAITGAIRCRAGTTAQYCCSSGVVLADSEFGSYCGNPAGTTITRPIITQSPIPTNPTTIPVTPTPNQGYTGRYCAGFGDNRGICHGLPPTCIPCGTCTGFPGFATCPPRSTPIPTPSTAITIPTPSAGFRYCLPIINGLCTFGIPPRCTPCDNCVSTGQGQAECRDSGTQSIRPTNTPTPLPTTVPEITTSSSPNWLCRTFGWFCSTTTSTSQTKTLPYCYFQGVTTQKGNTIWIREPNSFNFAQRDCSQAVPNGVCFGTDGSAACVDETTLP